MVVEQRLYDCRGLFLVLIFLVLPPLCRVLVLETDSAYGRLRARFERRRSDGGHGSGLRVRVGDAAGGVGC